MIDYPKNGWTDNQMVGVEEDVPKSGGEITWGMDGKRIEAEDRE